MSRDEWIYAILLLVSLAFGFVLKQIPGAKMKRLVAAAVGFTMVVIICGWHVLHSVITISVNYIIICKLKQIKSKRIGLWSFIWCFSYLLFFRTTHYFGLPQIPAVSNAVQLLLTLKMVGLAFEVSDSIALQQRLAKNPDDAEMQLQMQYESIQPTCLDIFGYAYCYIGLLTGPYFKFRTYFDWLQLDTRNIVTTSTFLQRLRVGLICSVIFLIASKFYWIEYVTTEEFIQSSFLYKLWFMTPIFMWFRARMYAAWLLSECVCITSCFGAYPVESKPRCGKGPTDLTALSTTQRTTFHCDFETIHNISVYGCEIDGTLRESMRAWNMSVQYWLATYIYKRFPIKSLRTSVTMAISAFWHGVHPGYYLSFMTVPFCLLSEDISAAAFRAAAPSTRQKIYDFIRWFVKMREFDYMCMGFLLLRFDHTIQYWSSIYFIIHINALLWMAAGLLTNRIVSKKNT